MPEISEEAMRVAIEAIKARCAQNDGAARWHAWVALEAAAPVLAEAWGVIGPEVKLAPELSRHAVLRVACPKCGSGSGEQCRSGTNRPVEPHSARFATAKRVGLFRDIPEVSREVREDEGHA